MRDYRDANPTATDRDPFADLVRAVEGSSVRSDVRGVREATHRDRGWNGFSYEPVASPGTGERMSAAVAGPRGKQTREIDGPMEEALRNLSQPAKPRDRYVTETQSFAPARQVEPEPEMVRQTMSDSRQTLTLDDFDDLIASEWAAMQPSSGQPQYDDEDYGQGFEDQDFDDRGEYRDYPVARPSRFRKPLMLLSGVAVLAVVAVAGAAYQGAGLSSITPGGDGPLLIKADAEPYKIAPADPGGRSIPNQNKAVYERVASGSATMAAPTQTSLLTAIEEPIDISENEDAPADDLPGVTVGDDLPMPQETADQVEVPETQVASAESTLQPRKVRTLTVRPDGTLAPAEPSTIDGAPAMIPASSTAVKPQGGMLDPVAGIQPAMPFGADNPEMTTASTMPVAAPVQPQAMPEAQVAAVAPPAEPSADAFFVQISSQPTQALAEESMANMTRRFASVIDGRSVGIKSAEIAGKGTFYRVRVAATSRNEASSLCDKLKSAGGSCFVTR